MKKYLFSISTAFLMAVLAFGTFAQQGELNKIPHGINPNSKSPNFPGFALTTGGTSSVSRMRYGGGALLSTPKIFIIWYGNWNQNNNTKGDTPEGQALIRQWANDIGNSPYYKLNISLSAGGVSITGNALFGGETTESGSSINKTGATSLSDTDIQAIAKNAVNSGRLPYDANGVYFVITPSNVTASSGFCTQYCGWHTSTTNAGTGRLRYSFIGNAARCYSACAAQSAKSPNGLPGIDAAISVLSHELEEANTDPDPLTGWADSRGQENADKCAWTFGHAQFSVVSNDPLISGSWANMTINSHNYLIQRNIEKRGNSFYCMVYSGQN